MSSFQGPPPGAMPSQGVPMGANAALKQRLAPAPMGPMQPQDSMAILDSHQAQHMDGEAMYGNPVLDAPPFDESVLGNLVQGPDNIGQNIGPMGSMMGNPVDSGAPDAYDVQAQNSMPQQNPEMKQMMIDMLRKKAMDRQAASAHFQQSAQMANTSSGQMS